MNDQINFHDLTKFIRNSHIVDLSHTIEEGMPVYPTHPQYFHMEWNTGDPSNLFQLIISEHAGTHLDCPRHFYGDPGDERRIPLEMVPVERFINPAVKLDFQGLRGDQQLKVADVEKWEEKYRPLQKGEAAIFYFGWDKKWKRLPAGKPFIESWPGITREVAEYLAEREVSLVGTDCLGIDGSSTEDLGTHFVVLEKGILIVENLKNLDQVPSEFILISLPLKIKDGTGCPIRAVALY
jgi:kynurenine formamidase